MPIGAALYSGSSPLTRGKPLAYTEADDARGLIPAHAGKTSRPGPRRSRPGAHPRSRGENIPQKYRPSREQGSSPLTRGKPDTVKSIISRRGLIPAHAGKTLSDLHFYRTDRSDLGKP